jgi:hypothetical protein
MLLRPVPRDPCVSQGTTKTTAVILPFRTETAFAGKQFGCFEGVKTALLLELLAGLVFYGAWRLIS